MWRIILRYSWRQQREKDVLGAVSSALDEVVVNMSKCGIRSRCLSVKVV